MIAQNQSKIEELNRSLNKQSAVKHSSPTFKMTRDMSIEGATRRSPNQRAAYTTAAGGMSPSQQIKPYSALIEGM